MLTLKFGGTSMGSARRILDSVEIMLGRAKTDRISVELCLQLQRY